MNKFMILLALSLFFTLSANAQQTLTFNSSHHAPLTTEDHTGALDLLYQELGKRLGIKILIQLLPAERALVNANEGIDDGDVARVEGLSRTYTGLVQVPEPIMDYKMGVFSRKASFTVDGSDSLKPYDVGIITGWKILERNIVGSHSLVRLEDGPQLFSMLDKNRIDVAVIESTEGLMLIKQLKLKNISLLQPYFLEGKWYLYLNKRHASLIPKIAATLRKMKEDGTYKRIFDSAISAYASDTLILNTGSSAPFNTPEHNGVLDLIYRSLAARLGINIQIEFLPAERALINANTGMEDGTICRVAGLEKQYPGLVRIPEELLLVKYNAFSKHADYQVKDFGSLRAYHVGIVLGRKILEEKVVASKSLTQFSTDEVMFKALGNNIIDVALIEKSQGLTLLKSHPQIKMLQPSLLQTSCYTYLNKKHAAWVPLFDNELKKMKRDGSYQLLLKQGMVPYLNGGAY